LFEDAYHLKKNPRFTLIDYNITTDRTLSPTSTEAGKAVTSATLKRRFAGIIAIDGVQHPIVGTGNGAISSLANALRSVDIDLDVADYKEHAIGGGRDVKAATYIECTATHSHEKVWGVGIHEDVVQASLIALLSAASSFLTSRSSTPVPFRPKRSNTFTDADLAALKQLSGPHGSSPLATPKASTAFKENVQQQKVDIAKLEERANGL